MFVGASRQHLVWRILSFLDSVSLGRVSCVSRRFHAFASADFLWEQLLSVEFGERMTRHKENTLGRARREFVLRLNERDMVNRLVYASFRMKKQRFEFGRAYIPSIKKDITLLRKNLLGIEEEDNHTLVRMDELSIKEETTRRIIMTGGWIAVCLTLALMSLMLLLLGMSLDHHKLSLFEVMIPFYLAELIWLS